MSKRQTDINKYFHHQVRQKTLEESETAPVVEDSVVIENSVVVENSVPVEDSVPDNVPTTSGNIISSISNLDIGLFTDQHIINDAEKLNVLKSLEARRIISVSNVFRK